MRAGYLTFALAAMGLVVVWALVGPPAPTPPTVSAALGLDDVDDVELDHRRALAVADRTAACMRARGFAYAPIPEPALAIPDPDLDPVAWAERWGFGVTTSVGRADAAPVADVNAARAAGLPADAREAYVRALHGGGADPGCHEAATTDVYGLRDRALEPLRAPLAELDRAIDTDPAMDRVRRTWAACASAAVAPLGSSLDATDRERLPSGLLAWFAARGRDAHSPRDLASAQALERLVAVAVARCETAYAARRASVATEHEAAFLRVHGEIVARIGAGIRAAEARLPAPPPASEVSDR